MRDVDAANARAILRTLPGCPLVFGTFGLVLLGRLAPENASDVDVLADLASVPHLVMALLAHGFRAMSWQDALTQAPSIDALTGRVYVRGDKGGLTIDVTYEGFDLVAWRSDATLVNGVAVASLKRIVALKQTRGTEKDLRVLSLLDAP